jgi:hypothetical protein
MPQLPTEGQFVSPIGGSGASVNRAKSNLSIALDVAERGTQIALDNSIKSEKQKFLANMSKEKLDFDERVRELANEESETPYSERVKREWDVRRQKLEEGVSGFNRDFAQEKLNSLEYSIGDAAIKHQAIANANKTKTNAKLFNSSKSQEVRFNPSAIDTIAAEVEEYYGSDVMQNVSPAVRDMLKTEVLQEIHYQRS